MRRVHLGLTTLLVLLAAIAGRAAAAEPEPIELPQGTWAQALAFGPDGNIWFTASRYVNSADLLGSATPRGAVREFGLPSRSLNRIGGVVAGPDGSVWFADTARSAIGRADLNGQVSEFPLPEGAAPERVAVGPDGAIWFTEPRADRVGRIDNGGLISTFPLPRGAQPIGLVAGPDGALWVAERGRDRIARVTIDGAVNEFPLGLPEAKPTEIVEAVNGDLWFSEESANRLGRIDGAGQLVEVEVPGNTGGPGGGTGALAAAPDGGVYFVTGTEGARNEIGSISSQGVVTGLGCINSGCRLPINGLAVGPDGGLWYGSGVENVGGGGGTGLAELYYGHGTIGTFAPPALMKVAVPAQRTPVRKRQAAVMVACYGGQGARCGGILRLEGRFKLPGWRHFSEAIIGQSRFSIRVATHPRVPVRLTKYGLRLLRLSHGRLRLVASASVHGGFGANAMLVLLRR